MQSTAPPTTPSGWGGQPMAPLDPARKAELRCLENISDRLNIMMRLLIAITITTLLTTWFVYTLNLKF